jgi:hypothetical protein
MLQQQPFVSAGRRAPSLDTNERPFAEHLFSFQSKGQLSTLERFHRIATRLDELPCSLIPDDDVARAVIPFRDHSFERGVVIRMILGHHRESAHRRVIGWPLRNGPRFQNAFHLEPEVVVQMRGVVFLNDEDRLFRRAFRRALRLGCVAEIAHLLVSFQRVGHVDSK